METTKRNYSDVELRSKNFNELVEIIVSILHLSDDDMPIFIGTDEKVKEQIVNWFWEYLRNIYGQKSTVNDLSIGLDIAGNGDDKYSKQLINIINCLDSEAILKWRSYYFDAFSCIVTHASYSEFKNAAIDLMTLLNILVSMALGVPVVDDYQSTEEIICKIRELYELSRIGGEIRSHQAKCVIDEEFDVTNQLLLLFYRSVEPHVELIIDNNACFELNELLLAEAYLRFKKYLFDFCNGFEKTESGPNKVNTPCSSSDQGN